MLLGEGVGAAHRGGGGGAGHAVAVRVYSGEALEGDEGAVVPCRSMDVRLRGTGSGVCMRACVRAHASEALVTAYVCAHEKTRKSVRACMHMVLDVSYTCKCAKRKGQETRTLLDGHELLVPALLHDLALFDHVSGCWSVLDQLAQ